MSRNPEVGLSFEEFLTTWLPWLPLTEDDQEAEHVYGYLCELIET